MYSDIKKLCNWLIVMDIVMVIVLGRAVWKIGLFSYYPEMIPFVVIFGILAVVIVMLAIAMKRIAEAMLISAKNTDERLSKLEDK